MSNKNPAIDAYIAKFPQWKKELTLLIKIIRKSKLEETIKWSRPTFCLDGKLVFGIGAFKNHFGIWYFQGALMKDESDVLINVQTGKTVAMRQWKFDSFDQIDTTLIHAYNQEAIKNEKAGKRIAPSKSNTKVVLMPMELEDHLKKNGALQKAYDQLTRGRQNDIKEYIGGAKRASTRIDRLEKSMKILKEGKTPMDQYRKS